MRPCSCSKSRAMGYRKKRSWVKHWNFHSTWNSIFKKSVLAFRIKKSDFFFREEILKNLGKKFKCLGSFFLTWIYLLPCVLRSFLPFWFPGSADRVPWKGSIFCCRAGKLDAESPCIISECKLTWNCRTWGSQPPGSLISKTGLELWTVEGKVPQHLTRWFNGKAGRFQTSTCLYFDGSLLQLMFPWDILILISYHFLMSKHVQSNLTTSIRGHKQIPTAFFPFPASFV